MNHWSELIAVIKRLRGEGGCPWDRAQTERSLRPYVLEEVYEVLEAMDRADDHALRGELGDLLFQIGLLAQMASERGAFDVDDVLVAITHKMVARHPHVFDPDYVAQGDEGEVNSWEARKARERSGSALDGVPDELPALLRAHRISEKAGRVGFDWPDLAGVRSKLSEELAELDVAIADQDDEAIEEELGDVLFTLVNLGRHLPVGAEEALRTATQRFDRRFRALEQVLASEGKTVYEVDVHDLETQWRAVKERR